MAPRVGLGTLNPRFVACPLELGLGTHNPRCVVWPLELGLGTHNPRFVAWPLELGLGTHNPRFVAWPLELGLGTHNPRSIRVHVPHPDVATPSDHGGDMSGQRKTTSSVTGNPTRRSRSRPTAEVAARKTTRMRRATRRALAKATPYHLRVHHHRQDHHLLRHRVQLVAWCKGPTAPSAIAKQQQQNKRLPLRTKVGSSNP